MRALIAIAAGTLALSVAARAAVADPPEYNRGYNDCLAGRYDEAQNSRSFYRQGCRAAEDGRPEFWGEVQPPASLKGLDIPSRRAVFVPWKPSRRPALGRETRLFFEEPMLSTGLHFASESTRGMDGRPRHWRSTVEFPT